MEWFAWFVCGALLAFDRFIGSWSRQRECCYETEVAVEVVFSYVIEGYGTKHVFRCRIVITYLQSETLPMPREVVSAQNEMK